MYEYEARLSRVVDGDTVDVLIDLGFGILSHQRLRLAGVDTEEMNDKDPARRERAVEAKDFVQEMLVGKSLTINTHKTRTGSYVTTFGRYVAEVFIDDGAEDGVSLADLIKSHGFEKQPKEEASDEVPK